MGNEYAFFDEDLCLRFLDYAIGRGISGSCRRDEMDAWVATLPDDMDDAVADEIETAYENFLVAQRERVEAAPGEDVRRVMGVSVVMPDGGSQVIRVPGVYALRLMEHFTLDEIRELVTAIANEAVSPHAGPLCKR